MKSEYVLDSIKAYNVTYTSHILKLMSTMCKENSTCFTCPLFLDNLSCCFHQLSGHVMDDTISQFQHKFHL